MDTNEIMARIARLSPEARALFWEVQRRGEEYEFHAPALEVLDDVLLSRIKGLSSEDQSEFFELFRVLGHYYRAEGLRLQAEGIRHEGFTKLIERAQELDRRAGRPVNEDMTLEEAVPKLEEAGELDTLDREYLNSVKGEIVWVPVNEEE